MASFMTVLAGCTFQPSRLSSLSKNLPKETHAASQATAQVIPKQKDKPTLVAVILPQANADLTLASSAVKNGIEAARRQNGTASRIFTRYYYTTDDIASPILQYRRAINDGAAIIIGPLTKTATDNLLRNTAITLPTFLLNTVNQPEKLPDNSYVMSLSIEEESKNMAETIHLHGYSEVIIVYADSKLSHRIGQAFAAQWRKVTHNLPIAVVMAAPYTDITELQKQMTAQQNAALFLAMTASEAAHIVPHLPLSSHPLYGISQIAPDYGQPEQAAVLKGITYTDIPLFLAPDRFTGYIHASPTSRDLERLYALGIDVYQQVTNYLQNKQLPLFYEGAAGCWLKTEGQELQRQLPLIMMEQAKVEAIP
jgi:outer membrane PBP1 activator LpoA protein